MEAKEFKALLNRYQEGKTSLAENASLERWYLQLNAAEDAGLSEADLLQARKSIGAKLELAQPMKLWPRIRIASGIAAAVATIVFSVWFFTNRHPGNPGDSLQTGAYATDIAPGKSGATISLSTGEVIQLDSTKNGVTINPTSLTYDDGSSLKDKGSSGTGFSLQTRNPVQMTARTARGQTYEFTLPDGTHVFLNADSKIIFPSQFIEEKRRIVVEGEAYFEVSKDKKHPFVVTAQNQEVEVLGTHFNIYSYADEPLIKTTLLEGAVKINNTAILKPGEQSQLNHAGRLKVTKVDAEEAVAWKNGKFVFDYETIESVMYKLSRWYNVEIIFKSEMGSETFSGTVSRFENISKILDKIAFTNNLKYKIEGRRITIMK